MKVHRYEIEVYESVIDWAHEMGQTQKRLLIPDKGVIGYRSKDQIDFFSDEENKIQEAQAIINGEKEGNYLGEIDLPDEEVLRVVSAGKNLNQAREIFHKNLQSLIEKF